MTESQIHTSTAPAARARTAFSLHVMFVALAALCAFTIVAAVGIYGWDYYTLSPPERVVNPKHELLRPSGTVGIKLGMAGLGLFVVLYTYLIRKRSRGLSKIGKTKHWLNFHVVAGITAPALITLHSSFKFQGIAGIAYWIMVAVMISGFVGRYLYSQVPRTLSAAEMSLRDIETAYQETAIALSRQTAFTPEAIGGLMAVPDRETVAAMALPLALLKMAAIDIARPFRVAALRRTQLSGGSLLLTLGGVIPSGNRELEDALSLARRQSWLLTKVVFLEKAQKVFHLWHVVHRPFSYSLVVLIVFHISVVAMLGYF